MKGFVMGFSAKVTYVRPFSAAQQPFSATMGPVICYFGGKNNKAKGKLQLKLKIYSFIRFLGKIGHL